VAQAGSVEQAYTVGWWLKPTMLSKPTLSVGGFSRLCLSNYHYRLVGVADCVGEGNTVGC